MYVFQHPLDVCFETASDDMSKLTMPRIEISVRHIDNAGRSDTGGYAVVHVPAALGTHEVSCRVWRPCGSFGDRFASFFVGGMPSLKNPDMRYGAENALEESSGTRLTRSAGGVRMKTNACGEVHLRLSVCRKKGMASEDGAFSGVGGEAEE